VEGTRKPWVAIRRAISLWEPILCAMVTCLACPTQIALTTSAPATVSVATATRCPLAEVGAEPGWEVTLSADVAPRPHPALMANARAATPPAVVAVMGAEGGAVAWRSALDKARLEQHSQVAVAV
jgi:hypothetical protein